MFKYSVLVCALGLILDFIIGDPQFLYHPVRLIGKLIETTEKAVRRLVKDSENGLKAAGFFLVAIVCMVTVCTVFALLRSAYSVNTYFGIGLESVLCYFMLAAKSLKKESMKVYDKIKADDLEGAREAVSMIVGRDTENLDKEGIIKAAVETVAENLSDGVIAPMLYMLIGGGVLGAFYKAVNTMDSMVGYKNDRYIYFGCCAAKLDDILNFIPSRISAAMLIAAAFILKKDYKNAVRIFKRDRFKHASPNSAQTEAACAGALRIRLAGNAHYFGKLYEKPFIGDSLSEITEENIAEVNKMMYTAVILAAILFGTVFLLGGVFVW